MCYRLKFIIECYLNIIAEKLSCLYTERLIAIWVAVDQLLPSKAAPANPAIEEIEQTEAKTASAIPGISSETDPNNNIASSFAQKWVLKNIVSYPT